MRVGKIEVVRKKFFRATNLFRRRAIILLYHRIANMSIDPQLLCVSPSNFRDHMRHLRQNYQPISLKDLRSALINNNIPQNAVVVTFDDGYADNLYNAVPILEEYNVPATIFVSSGYVNRNFEFTSDILERCLLNQRQLPASLHLNINGREFMWDIDSSDISGITWDVTKRFYPTSRHKCYYDLHKSLKSLNCNNRKEILDQLTKWASIPATARSDHRALNEEELRKINGNGLIEIGSHGRDHINLAMQSCKVQWDDILESKLHLEKILQSPICSFSYPYGTIRDINNDTVDLVRKVGFKLACANIAEPVTANSNHFMLPRHLVRNWSKDEFSKHIKRAFYV